MIKRAIFTFLLFSVTTICLSQDNEREGNFFAVGINYGLDFPIGSLADRFGSNFHAGLSLDFFRPKFKGAFGIEAFTIFGDNVNEDVVLSLRNTNGAIFGFDGRYADVFLRERGNYIGLYMDKVILPRKNNERAGLSLGLGLGMIQHKIRIQVDTNNATHLEGEYLKGYDRNSVGPSLKQSIKYLHVGKNKNLNYAFALNFYEASTKITRAVNFDTGETTDDRQWDFLIGIDFKWYLPIKDTRKAEEIFY